MHHHVLAYLAVACAALRIASAGLIAAGARVALSFVVLNAAWNTRAAQGGGVVGWGGQVLPPFDNATVCIAVSAGGEHTVALRRDGTVVDWGFYCCGPPAGLSNVVGIAAGADHDVALRSDGTVVAWGGNAQGQSTVPAGLTNVMAIAAGVKQSMALRSDGTVVAWGNDGQHQNEVPSGLTNVIAVADGVDHCLAIVAVPPRLILSNPQWQSGVFTVSVPTKSGRSYALQYRENAGSGPWTSLPTVTGTGSTLTLTDSSASSGKRFYRVSEQ